MGPRLSGPGRFRLGQEPVPLLLQAPGAAVSFDNQRVQLWVHPSVLQWFFCVPGTPLVPDGRCCRQLHASPSFG
jgi:hypothetical protein